MQQPQGRRQHGATSKICVVATITRTPLGSEIGIFLCLLDTMGQERTRCIEEALEGLTGKDGADTIAAAAQALVAAWMPPFVRISHPLIKARITNERGVLHFKLLHVAQTTRRLISCSAMLAGRTQNQFPIPDSVLIVGLRGGNLESCARRTATITPL